MVSYTSNEPLNQTTIWVIIMNSKTKHSKVRKKNLISNGVEYSSGRRER